MSSPTIYTVNVWFKDCMAQVHEKEFKFNDPDVAREFQTQVLCILTGLRKANAIGANVVTVNPPLP